MLQLLQKTVGMQVDPASSQHGKLVRTGKCFHLGPAGQIRVQSEQAQESERLLQNSVIRAGIWSDDRKQRCLEAPRGPKVFQKRQLSFQLQKQNLSVGRPVR